MAEARTSEERSGKQKRLPGRLSRPSRILTALLRHKAERNGLFVRPDGFVEVRALLALPAMKKVSVEDLRLIVRLDKKTRFSMRALEEGGPLFIRANQGHTMACVKLEALHTQIFAAEELPVVIHGTYLAPWKLIRASGLKRMGRNAVHFAAGEVDGREVVSGFRSDVEVKIYLDVAAALAAGLRIFRSENNVILCPDDVPPTMFSQVILTATGERLYPRPDGRALCRFDHLVALHVACEGDAVCQLSAQLLDGVTAAVVSEFAPHSCSADSFAEAFAPLQEWLAAQHCLTAAPDSDWSLLLASNAEGEALNRACAAAGLPRPLWSRRWLSLVRLIDEATTVQCRDVAHMLSHCGLPDAAGCAALASLAEHLLVTRAVPVLDFNGKPAAVARSRRAGKGERAGEDGAAAVVAPAPSEAAEGEEKEEKEKAELDYVVVLDFEATCDRSRKFKPVEVIEFPAVLLNLHTLEAEDEFRTYCRPTHHPELTAFCTELTGITQETVDAAPLFHDALAEFVAWMDVVFTERAGAKFALLTCGDWDLRIMLPKQASLYDPLLTYPAYMRRWINVKRPFRDTYGVDNVGMAGMLRHLKLELIGRHHSGLDDCRNIARIAAQLVRDGCKLAVTTTAKPPKAKKKRPSRAARRSLEVELSDAGKAAVASVQEAAGQLDVTAAREAVDARERGMAIGRLLSSLMTDDLLAPLSDDEAKVVKQAAKRVLQERCG
eukprot:PLAT12261.2.p1 GENE.PLAT12261.2~~PLAT12261.2.p1  ORF type:complete len:738 (+),score=261.09 PLAT12261.2:50-2215(+)